MADHRADIYPDGDRLIFRASSLNQCPTRVAASALGMEAMPHPDFLQRAFDEGSDAEDALIQRWLNGDRVVGPGACIDQRWRDLLPTEFDSYHDGQGNSFPYSTIAMLDDDQFTCEIPVGARNVIRGHLDGIAQCFQIGPHQDDLLGRRCVVEAKFLGPDFYKKWLKQGWSAFPYYAMQVSLYSYATNLPVAFIVGQKLRQEDGPTEIGDVHVTWVEPDDMPVHVGVAKAKVIKLAKIVDSGVLPECTELGYPCPFYYLHDEDAAKEVEVTDAAPPMPEFKPADAERVKNIGTQLDDLKTEASWNKKKQDQLKAELKELVADYGGTEQNISIRGDGYTLKWTHQEVAEKVTKAHTRSYPTLTKDK